MLQVRCPWESKCHIIKKLANGYEVQLEEYKNAEYSSGHNIHGVYLVINLGVRVDNKLDDLHKIHNTKKLSDLIIIDASKRESASKIKYD
jgi:hypothetical protein